MSVTSSMLTLILCMTILWLIGVRNKLERYRIVIEESKRNVDIALEKRYDTISEMLKIAKSYAKHEEKVFTELVKLRQGLSLEETNDVMRTQEQALNEVFAVGEAYPEMRSSEQFLSLQNEIAKENAALAAAKRIVNSNISLFNQAVVAFPVSIVASLINVKQMTFLDIDLDHKKSFDQLDYTI